MENTSLGCFCSFTQQLLLRSNYFFRTVTFFRAATFSEQFIQSFFETGVFSECSYIFKEKLLSSSYFLKKENRQFFRLATFSVNRLVQNKDNYRRSTFSEQIIFWMSCFTHPIFQDKSICFITLVAAIHPFKQAIRFFHRTSGSLPFFEG